jgi:two-component system, NtrC family, response regulator AtoC
LFLDEIGEMDLPMQAKLLRVIQEREFTRIGGNQLIKTDCRLIVATHKNLLEEVKKGNFREDLYYRLLGLQIHLPPLRERAGDIVLLAEHFIQSFCRENKLPPKKLLPDTKKKLTQYPFPGNIRELKSIIELAIVMADTDEINADSISLRASDGIGDIVLEEKTMKEYYNDIIKLYLKKYNNNVLLVADKLDIGKSTIYRLLKEE